MFPLSHLMKHFVKNGQLTIINADGEYHVFTGKEKGSEIVIRLSDKSLYGKLVFNPELAAGEAYMDGTLTFEYGTTLKDFLYFFRNNSDSLRSHPLQKILRWGSKKLRRWQQVNKKGKVHKNVAHHYDLGNDFFRLFLDDYMTYSCAYFRDDNETLEQAQRNKFRLVASKLNLRQGQKILDIGCGWGSMAFYLATVADVEVTGVTLSAEQRDFAKKRAKELGLDSRVEIRLQDYRNINGQFDRIVSVGMFEHVGVPYFDEFFAKINKLMPDDGVMLLHSIGGMDPPNFTSPWIRKYIFPNGYSPSLSEAHSAIERNRLWPLDIECLRIHYSKTLEHWYQRFEKNRDKIVAMYDERFARMWELYLLSCESVFSAGTNFVFQTQLSRSRDAMPITRDYIIREQHRLERLEKKFEI